jgi:hypothetical protein
MNTQFKFDKGQELANAATPSGHVVMKVSGRYIDADSGERVYWVSTGFQNLRLSADYVEREYVKAKA